MEAASEANLQKTIRLTAWTQDSCTVFLFLVFLLNRQSWLILQFFAVFCRLQQPVHDQTTAMQMVFKRHHLKGRGGETDSVVAVSLAYLHRLILNEMEHLRNLANAEHSSIVWNTSITINGATLSSLVKEASHCTARAA